MSYLFRDAVPGFEPSPSVRVEEDAILFAFRDGALLHRDDPFAVPTVGEARAAGLAVPDPLSLGMLDGRPAAFAHVPVETPLPPLLRASALRRLFFSLQSLASTQAAALANQLAHFEAANQFCGGCARPLTRKAGERAKRCDACNRDLYPQIAPCTIVLVHDGDKIVLARAPRLPPGMYALVAGFVEPGETLEGCVAREVREEVGLDVADIRYVASQPWPFPSQLMVGFFARATGGDLKADPSEIEDAQWFSIDELPSIPPPFSVARFLIDAYVAERRGRRT